MAKKSGKITYRKVKWVWPLFFLLPYFSIYLVFSFFPVIYSFYLSLTNWNGLTEKVFIGFENYKNLITDTTFWNSIKNTFILASVTPVHMLIILVVSVMLYSQYCKFRKTAQTLIFLPYITTIVALGLIFSQLFQWKNGLVNMLLLELGLIREGINWLGRPWLARFVTTLIIQWRFLGYSCVIVMAGLSNISKEFYEAAEIDGANSVQKFFKITIPLLRPILLFMTITSISGSMQMFEIPLMLFQSGGALAGGPRGSVLTAIWYMYETAFSRTMRYGYASAITYAIFVIMAVLSLISFKIAKGED